MIKGSTFPNLIAEMARIGLGVVDLKELLKQSRKSVENKLSSKTPFKVTEMKLIKSKYFPSMTLDYLFSENPITEMEA